MPFKYLSSIFAEGKACSDQGLQRKTATRRPQYLESTPGNHIFSSLDTISVIYFRIFLVIPHVQSPAC